MIGLSYFFFFKGEDGIRYYRVTGVQTCALPICPGGRSAGGEPFDEGAGRWSQTRRAGAFVPSSSLTNRQAPTMTLRLAEDPLFSDRFGTGAPFRVGVEEELFLVDHHAHAVSPCTDELLAVLRRPLPAGPPAR